MLVEASTFFWVARYCDGVARRALSPCEWQEHSADASRRCRASAAWLVFISFEHRYCSVEPIWILDSDYSSVADTIEGLSFGCPVVVAGFGFESRSDEPWCSLAACGCPVQVSVADNAVESGDDAMAFAMVGVRGLRPGSAVFSASQDVATATRRIYKHLSLKKERKGVMRACVGRETGRSHFDFLCYFIKLV